MIRRGKVYWRWVRNVTLGEFLGFLVPSVVGVLTVALKFDQLSQTSVMVLAGLAEGMILGAFQARVLRQYIQNFNTKRWIQLTMVGAGLAWIIGMLPSTLGDRVMTIPWWILSLLVAGGATMLLLTIGTAQYVVLREYVSHAYRWVWVTAASWLAGLSIVVIAIAIAPDGVMLTILFSAMGGLGMAFVMAAITGVYTQKIVRDAP